MSDMMNDNIKLIAEIQIPESLKRELVSIQNSMMSTWKNKEKEWDFTCGYAPRPELDFISDIYWETFCYVTDVNTVIAHLNIVIRDLNFLSANPDLCRMMLGGKVSQRYNLLTRTFFYELFRVKEIHNRQLKYLRRKSVLTKSEVDEYKSEFLVLFDAFIKLRNKMVHSIFVFPGVEHQELWMTEFLSEQDMALMSLKTGELIKGNDVINNVCKDFINMALSAGDGLVGFFQVFSQACCQLADWMQEGKVRMP